MLRGECRARHRNGGVFPLPQSASAHTLGMQQGALGTTCTLHVGAENMCFMAAGHVRLGCAHARIAAIYGRRNRPDDQ